ncbi:MAG: hypothetical protein KAH23_00140 [Kiritimatiellae bacterium]|nr:hypothetical protein [Kiritimatiellia bacterium]
MKLRKSWLSKGLRKTFGDKTGGVMMEYVILAVLIAAAVVVAVAMFGKTIVGMFDVAGKGATGDHTGAKTTLTTTRTDQNTDATSAKTYHDGMHK